MNYLDSVASGTLKMYKKLVGMNAISHAIHFFFLQNR